MHNVYLIQPNYDFGPNNTPEYYLPYTVGILWSYSAQFDSIKNNFKLAEIIFKRENIEVVLSKIDNPKVVAFSCYVWNWEYNKALAEKIKQKYPTCLIVFGGPSVTDNAFQKMFFQQHRYVDCIINGEGEYSFKELLQAIVDGTKIKKIYHPTRIDDLTTIPSPYLTGVFDDMMKVTNVGWQMVLETNRGCPFACTFCDWGSLTYSKIKKFDYDRVIKELEWAVEHKIGYVYIADANFGIFKERDKQISLKIAKMKQETGYPEYVAVTWNKNAKLDIIEIAKILGSRGLTVSMQSMDEQVLEEIKRKNMDISNLSALLPECEKAQVPVYTELILGLPYETAQTWRDGHYKLLDYQQHAMLEVYLSMILENSELNTQEQITKHNIEIVSAENYLSGNSNISEENSIVEKISLIRSTKYMTAEDIIDSFMFSWLILTFHYIGYTQIYSRYVNKKYNISYQRFYDSLFDYVKGSSTLLNTEYINVRNIISTYLTTGKLDGVSKFNAGANIIWNSTKIFPKQLHTVRTELAEFFKIKFKEVGETYAIDLLQHHFTVDINKTYPYLIEVPQDVYATVFGGTFNNKTVSLTLSSLINETDPESFCRKIYTGRRSSSSKVIIEVDK